MTRRQRPAAAAERATDPADAERARKEFVHTLAEMLAAAVLRDLSGSRPDPRGGDDPDE